MRYTETAVRRALRYRRRHAEDGQPELLAKVLPADESYDPPHALADDPSPSDTAPDAQLSQASAWLFLVGRSGNEVQRLAAGLLISESHGYHGLARARGLARRQYPLAIRCTDRDGLPLQPKGWRALPLRAAPHPTPFHLRYRAYALAGERSRAGLSMAAERPASAR